MTASFTARRRHAPLRTGATLTIAAALVMLLSSCESDPTNIDSDNVVGFDRDWDSDTNHPLLREDDLGFGYSDDPADGEEEDLTEAGCLSAIAALSAGSTRQQSVAYTSDNPFDSMIVKHAVLEFDTADGPADALSQWEDTAAECDTAEYVQDDSVLRLEVAMDGSLPEREWHRLKGVDGRCGDPEQVRGTAIANR